MESRESLRISAQRLSFSTGVNRASRVRASVTRGCSSASAFFYSSMNAR